MVGAGTDLVGGGHAGVLESPAFKLCNTTSDKIILACIQSIQVFSDRYGSKELGNVQ